MPWCNEARGKLQGSFHLHRQRVLGIRWPVHNRGEGTLPLCLIQSAQGPGGAWQSDRKLGPYSFLMTSYMEQRELAFIEFLLHHIKFLPKFSQDRNDCILLCRCSHIAELGLEANTD